MHRPKRLWRFQSREAAQECSPRRKPWDTSDPHPAKPRRGVRKFRQLGIALILALLLALLSCSQPPNPNTLVMIIESSPTNLDPRIGVDAQSERIDELIFDALFTRDEHFNVRPGLAESWDTPDPLTYVLHLRHGVNFHNGQPLTSRDVKWSLESLLDKKIRSTKTTAYRFIDRIEAPDEFTVVLHLKEPYDSLLWNLSEGAIGIVPYGALDELASKPIGSGPFKFVSAEQDKEVILEHNDNYWGGKPKLAQVRFAVVPDATTRALELRKGSADIAINAFSSDTVLALEANPNLQVERAPGTILSYMSFNMRDPILRDVRVRQAIACAIDRRPLIQYIWRGFAQPATSVLPIQSWAYNAAATGFAYDPAQARAILDAAGYPAHDGVRFHLTMKTSTEESTRLLAAVFQQQFREIGIVLDIRTFEFSTFLADVTSGSFQVYSLRWIGNEDPAIFDMAFHSRNFPPAGRNRGFYSNSRVDTLIDQARREPDQKIRRQMYFEVQQILAREVPYVNLWYFDNVLVHTKRVNGLTLNLSGNYNFLKTAQITTQ